MKYTNRWCWFNPEILSSEGEIVAEEGCLSIPDVTADVKRPERIVVEGINIQRQPIRIEADGLLARVLLHEIDHLNGVLFIDRISGLKRRLLSDELLRLQQASDPLNIKNFKLRYGWRLFRCNLQVPETCYSEICQNRNLNLFYKQNWTTSTRAYTLTRKSSLPFRAVFDSTFLAEAAQHAPR